MRRKGNERGRKEMRGKEQRRERSRDRTEERGKRGKKIGAEGACTCREGGIDSMTSAWC